MTPKPDIERVAERLSKAQRELVCKLTSEWIELSRQESVSALCLRVAKLQPYIFAVLAEHQFVRDAASVGARARLTPLGALVRNYLMEADRG